MHALPHLDIPPLACAGGAVALPGSKSISNRALLLAALCEGTTGLDGLLISDDTQVMLDALRTLGCTVERHGDHVRLTGLGAAGPAVRDAKLFLGNAGTAMRPLAATLALRGMACELRGNARMHERPIGDLVDALRAVGCAIDYSGEPGFPPLRIAPAQLQLDRPLRVRGDVSSQFLSSLLLALPQGHPQAVHVEVEGELISKPYVEITLALMAKFGVAVERQGWSRFSIPAGAAYLSPGALRIEPDASSATYFIALGAMAERCAGRSAIEIAGLDESSVQGDIRFIDAARAMGANVTMADGMLRAERGAWPLKAIDRDCNDIPDAAMTLAVMALFADGPSTLRNIASWRVKETDRLAAMAKELTKLGATVEERPDSIRIEPPKQWQAATVATYDDHRMAMCFALAALNPAGLPVRIEDPKCVAKTFPEFFKTLFAAAQARLHDVPVICIDGPTASGKGTLAAAVAARLGWHYLDSGALYRLAGLAARRLGLALDPGQEAAIGALSAKLPVEFLGGKALLDGTDVTETIRSEEAGMDASRVSALPPVRAGLLALQHGFRRLPGLVADGRDMGTVVFPAAPLKVYLTASAGQRADRRHKQLILKGISANIDTLRADLEARDARDSSRSVAPLKPAPEALLLDNSELSIEQSVQQVLQWWEERQPFAQAAG